MHPYRERFIEFGRSYERRLSAVAMVVGFVFDLFLAKRPDSIVDNVLLLSYLFIAGSIIVLLNLRMTRQEQQSAKPLLLLFILQFCFGGLASNLLVLYGHSGTLAGSAFFIALLVAMLVGNEFLQSRYAHLRFNVGVYYLLLLTYCIIALPTFVLHAIGWRAFLLSGAVSLVVVSVFLTVLLLAVFRGAKRQLYEVCVIVLGIFLVFSGFYFLNVIPPVPLSLKEIGIYHSLAKDSSGNYRGSYEAAPWYVFWRDTSDRYTIIPGESAYCFSAVFAPSELTAPIYHRWEYYNEPTRHWLTIARVAFPITGGRAEGYRGFSTKTKLAVGAWRCSVETAGGQLIGRITFDIQESSTTPALLSASL